jgi:hypothetical protein
MNAKRLYFGLIGLLCLLFFGLVAGAYGVNAMLTSRATKLTTLKAKDTALEQEQLNLVKAKQEIKQYGDLQKIAQAVVPEDKDQAEAVRQIVNIAGANGVSLAAINFPASSLGNTTAGAAAGSTSSGPAPVNVGPVKINANAGKLSQLQPVKNIPGVYVLQLTVQSDPTRPVPYSSFINFLRALEHNRRTAQISSITLQPNPTNPGLLGFTLTINEYIKS